jgi:hypothetical protein
MYIGRETGGCCMKKFQVICLKCGSEDVGISHVVWNDMVGLESEGLEFECKNCGNFEEGDE